jgi:hypothetical protein
MKQIHILIAVLMAALITTGCNVHIKASAEYAHGGTDVMANSTSSTVTETKTNTYTNPNGPATVNFADKVKDVVGDAVGVVAPATGDEPVPVVITPEKEAEVKSEIDKAIEDAINELERGG